MSRATELLGKIHEDRDIEGQLERSGWKHRGFTQASVPGHGFHTYDHPSGHTLTVRGGEWLISRGQSRIHQGKTLRSLGQVIGSKRLKERMERPRGI